MKYIVKIGILLTFIVCMTSCKSTYRINLEDIHLANIKASEKTKILYERIKTIPNDGFAFGQQDATIYGINWKQPDAPLKIRSDIKDVSGKLPAVHGYDLGHIELNHSFNLDTVSFLLMRDQVKKMYKKGAIITFSWHLDNPVTDGSSWDTTAAVSEILKGGLKREKYEKWVSRLSVFFKSLNDEKDQPIPVVFRPFHEMNGGWFWWGEGNCSAEDYKELWRQTFILLQQNNVQNLLFAYSPNIMQSKEDFERYYPGDEYVDILGVDIYNYGGKEAFIKNIQTNLEILRSEAQKRSKPYALTETGNISPGSDPDWWTNTLYEGIKKSGISWVLLWRNARLDHYFSTYPDDISAENFREFEKLEESLFLDQVKQINFKL
ncbi:glycoside hydrolase family 26 protein [Christiangramia portivictoriae]|uniref:glycoside hydrolase family 26 protein n=1 Tax=Christiangramia portivictoriae TaxID=326069 RepID=UPI000684BDD7|nr:glycosyl hydrolase [Christiangramia portivictoriae]